MLVLPPPLTTPFPSIHNHTNYFPIQLHRHYHVFQPPQSSANPLAFSTKPTILDEGPDDILSLQNRRYDFTPLLRFLSDPSTTPESDPNSLSPTSLDSTEFQLAESYRAVPAPLWHALLKSLCSSSSSSSISLAYAVVSWLQKHNLCFSYELLYSILINALGRSEKLYEAFLLSQRQVLTPLTYNALIGACARNGDVEKALNLMSRMRRDGYQPDFVNYSSIIQYLTRSNRIDSPILQKLYREIESDKIEIDGHLMNDIILGFSKAGDPSRAMRFLAMAQGNGLSPKSATFVAVIHSLGNSGRTQEAEALFEEIKENGLEPRTKAYNALLKGYVKTGSLKDAEFVVSEMEKAGVMPDEQTYSLLIDAYAHAGRWESARIVLKEMEASNVQPNSYVYSRILASYRDKGEWQKSFQVLKEMKNSGVMPDRHFYNVMIDTFGKYNCLDHAMATFERMLSEGIRPDTVTWNTLIDCHCKSGRHDRAEELFREMQQSGYLPCTTTYNIMINSMGEQERWDRVSDLLSKMQSQGLLPNSITYTTLVDVYGRSGRFGDAMDCLEVLKSMGFKPTSTMYNALINAYAQKTSIVIFLLGNPLTLAGSLFFFH
ncbi:pentatricopeptide repeat-containing protein At5g42310, chloroplastic isoform X3 [Abrus precatorius]|uniref:Pentatricopeptide repeat-containing protein At5g42310, chloroplastic isoform X3 n=1 Tax=Abrus precatorius TaxID=3816 RepID=A0A8B8LD40_ABRPR|nr:pentatricopeptide repeat-containing protein At5g42310, chloroplastic isoform X3 [Abrus precatorius]